MGLRCSERLIYDCLRRLFALNGYAPTIREIEEDLKISSRSFVQNLLVRLEQKGYIEKQRGKSRTIRLACSELPLMGFIQAGFLTEHPERYSEQVCLDGQRYQDGDYALTVSGDSMIDAQIFDGDIVVIRPIKDLWAIHHGQIAVVWIDGEGTTLKRVYYDEGDNQITLKPANPAHPSRTLERSQVGVQGIMVGQHRHDDGLWVAVEHD
ncbi:transcriptional repressor LexA [Nodosilinea nodulosa]|uniref:transcriptional repressor LexA n=1 Tax=Nodosilinea nodulosa TaxID=416001 RepID=UPI000316B0B5|nr:transcriptional repressor LexA [Nodosilinea nodulosa]